VHFCSYALIRNPHPTAKKTVVPTPVFDFRSPLSKAGRPAASRFLLCAFPFEYIVADLTLFFFSAREEDMPHVASSFLCLPARPQHTQLKLRHRGPACWVSHALFGPPCCLLLKSCCIEGVLSSFAWELFSTQWIMSSLFLSLAMFCAEYPSECASNSIVEWNGFIS